MTKDSRKICLSNTPDTLGNDAVSLTASAFGRASHFLQVSPGPDLEKNDAPFAVTLAMSWFWGLKNVRTIVKQEMLPMSPVTNT